MMDKDAVKQLALRVMNLVDGLPKTDKSRVLGKQLLRCGTSVGANYTGAHLNLRFSAVG